jgi:uncharacterized protein (DUF433 family)
MKMAERNPKKNAPLVAEDRSEFIDFALSVSDGSIAAGWQPLALHVRNGEPTVPCFSGTHVAVQSLFEFLESGEGVSDFLLRFPSVKREQVIAALEEGKYRTLASAVTK